MAETLPILLPALLLAASWLGWRVQRALPERHRGRDTVDAVRLVLGMLITFAALVLGLLTSTAKTHFDTAETTLQTFGVDLIELDQRLRDYGPDTAAIRGQLRAYTAAALVDTWPNEPAPSGSYPHHPTHNGPNSAESLQLGDMLLRVDRAVGRLAPADPAARDAKRLVSARMSQTLQQRWVVLESAQATVSWPFLLVMTLWLALVFAIFGLSSPANGVVYGAIGVTALSVSAAMWLILELESPLTGLLKVSSTPIVEALAHMDRPTAQEP